MIFVVLGWIVTWICNILIILLLIRSALSWVMYFGDRRMSGSVAGKIYRIAIAMTEPIVKPVRNLISRFIRTGPIDIAPLAAFFIIVLVSRILVRILIRFI